jgi:hypothetical protein
MIATGGALAHHSSAKLDTDLTVHVVDGDGTI